MATRTDPMELSLVGGALVVLLVVLLVAMVLLAVV